MNGFHFIQDLAVILVVAGVVGWICQRIGLSVIVGFLVAGMVVGPHTPITLVADVERIDTLAQIGLVFLMFSIGLQLSLKKLRRLGLSLMVATFVGAIIMYHLSRLLALSMGWGVREGLFLAGMLMVSSSAIISKILQETGLNHERSGQFAMGVAVVEDVVAVVMLTILNSMVQLGQGGNNRVPETLLLLGAFVVLAGIGGLLLVPWLLKRMSISADEELQTLGMAGLLFGLAVVAQTAGYSLALGAFLLGTIVAETPHRHQVVRTFEGMRDVFSAVFFVAIGMQIDALDLWREAGVIVGIAAFTLLARPLAVATGLSLIGTPLKEGLRTGLMAGTIGEFSFIIAQLGVASKVVPARFYPIAVGVSLITTLMAPILMRRSEAIADAAVTRQPKWLEDWWRVYHGWLARMRQRTSRNLLWQLSRKRVVQLTVGVLFVTGLIVFSGQLFAVVDDWLGRRFPPNVVQLGFWVALALIVLAPLVAIWRNLSAMAMVYAEISTRGHAEAKRMRRVIEVALKVGAGVMIYLWLVAVLPADGTAHWLLLVSAIVAVLAVIVLRRKLIYWHSEMEVEILNVMDTAESRMTATEAPWLASHGEWNLQMIDCTLPDLADCQGKPIAELDLRARFGCTVVGIERQGYMIPLPPPDAVLYPRDKVLLMGTVDQVKAGRKFLSAVSGAPVTDSVFAEVRMESVVLPPWSRAAGRTLGELSPARNHGVQIAGVHRGGLRILNPSAAERLENGDEILMLGTPVQNQDFKTWLRERVEPSDASAAG
ncbi:cation:proton antiporter domain-containing protein [Horticoccus sp. 23ND18S-11]|uniref:cation:proton antiporter domain-containing protein n=1 Tax=Horticoccus sp. 23ND18S-11 TaxID=3391832 RepID=UPI0039C8C29C